MPFCMNNNLQNVNNSFNAAQNNNIQNAQNNIQSNVEHSSIASNEYSSADSNESSNVLICGEKLSPPSLLKNNKSNKYDHNWKKIQSDYSYDFLSKDICHDLENAIGLPILLKLIKFKPANVPMAHH